MKVIIVNYIRLENLGKQQTLQQKDIDHKICNQLKISKVMRSIMYEICLMVTNSQCMSNCSITPITLHEKKKNTTPYQNSLEYNI